MAKGKSPAPNQALSPAAAPPKNPWTDAQRRGIETVGRNLLISAAAGSGKTTVLAQRCVHLVCDTQPPCDVDRLLVVTFTEAAAAEMKSRIHTALMERYKLHPSPRLAMQLALIDRAHVSTLHGFCARLLRQHFHLLGLDPSFDILDADEADLMRLELARDMMADRYEQDEDGRFQALIDTYGEGDDRHLAERIVKMHEMLCSIVDPADWIEIARARLEEAVQKPLDKSILGTEYRDYIETHLVALLEQCREAEQAILSMGKAFSGYIQHLRDWQQMIAHWRTVLDEFGLAALTEVAGEVELPRLPAISNSVPNKDLAKARMDAVREQIVDGAWRQNLKFTPEELRAGLRAILPHAQVLLNLVEDFTNRYAKAKDAEGVLDFSDLERFALRALRDPAVAHGYEQQFHQVLVDEYQDINAVQDAILILLSRSDNLFCVGDVKQSIYRFRLAEPKQFLDRRQLYADPLRGMVINLLENFRSRKPLLDAINEIFKRLMTQAAAEIDYDQTHQLVPGLDYPSGDAACFTGAPIELHLLPSKLEPAEDDEDDSDELDRTEREALVVTHRIAQMLGRDGSPPMQVMEKSDDGLAPRRIRPGDIVILLRSMKFKADQFADALRGAGIAAHSQSGGGFFQSMEIRDLLSLLSLLDNQLQDIPLAAVLRSPLADMPRSEDAMARIRLAYNDPKTPVPFHQAVIDYARAQTDELAAKLRDFLEKLAEWRRLAHQRPLAEVLWTIYDSTGYLAFCAGQPSGEQRLANLLYLHERATQFGTFRRQGLSRFLRFLEKLEAEFDLGQPSVASEADDVVRIMSIHRSKGLEFPVVFLPDLGKKINFDDCSGSILVDRSAYLGMRVIDPKLRVHYPSLAWLMVKQSLHRQTIAEELRVLYVAMTRAREHLVLCGSCAEKLPPQWQSRWGSHIGPLPPDVVLDARAMLNWLGPAAAAINNPAIIRLEQHTLEQIEQWQRQQSDSDRPDPAQAALAALQPLSPAPAPNAQATEVVERLIWPYPYDAYAREAAARAVTSWVDHAPHRPAGGDDPSTMASPSESQLDLPALPRFLAGAAIPSAADIGTATHAALEHLDFSHPANAASIKAQIQSMIDSGRLLSAEAAVVDIAAIAWLMEHELGNLLRRHAANVWRELPVYFAMPPENTPAASDDPLDRIMVRGRLDMVLSLPDGNIIIDYKTDRVRGDVLKLRAAEYAPQMRLYRQAVETITGKTVKAVHLVFLHAREVVQM